MSLLSSLYTGTSGMQANSQELSVVGDNIANANTIGFKSNRAVFENALSQSLIGGTGETGLGTRMQAVQRIVTQGSLVSTGVATDLALQGDGLFVVKGIHGGQQGTYYTRAGQFTVDKQGFLTTLDGLRVQGNPANATGAINSALSDLNVGDQSAPPTATANITLRGNLNADAPVPAAAWDPTQPQATSNFSTSVTLYDSLGRPHQADVFYSKVSDGSWEWHALTDGANIELGTPGVATEIASGTLAFDTEGKLVDATQTSDFNPRGANLAQPLTFNFGDPTSAGGTGQAGITQFANASTTTFVNQDGSTAGDLASVEVDTQGNITGAFTNGRTRVLGRVAVAEFSAPDQLRALSGNMFLETEKSGQPTIGGAGEGGRGSIIAGSLEQSNVDLASEFVRMIAAQRGFQANSKTITTADQLLNELISLKR